MYKLIMNPGSDQCELKYCKTNPSKMYSFLLLQMNAEKMHLTFTLSKNLKKKRRKLAARLSIASTCSITICPPGLHVSYSSQTGGTRDNFLRTRRLRNSRSTGSHSSLPRTTFGQLTATEGEGEDKGGKRTFFYLSS